MELKSRLLMSVFFNFILQGKIQTIIASNLLLFPIYLYVYIFNGKVGLLFFFILIQIFVISIAISNFRLSEVIVYNKLLRIVSMSLSNINRYKNYDYNNEVDKQKICTDFKEEFILGLLNVENKSKKMSMITHKWVVLNILQEEKILSKYFIDIKPLKKRCLTFDVLILSRKETKSAYIKREIFKVKLIKK